jgi:hypothetical protein
LRNSLNVSHGEITNATRSEKTIAADALMGMGCMYGPMSPETNASGSSAATTANVARMVGFPTSSTAKNVASRGLVQPSS